MTITKLREAEKELTIFRNVVGVNKLYTPSHMDVTGNSKVALITKCRGLARAKLRKYVAESGVSYEFWCK